MNTKQALAETNTWQWYEWRKVLNGHVDLRWDSDEFQNLMQEASKAASKSMHVILADTDGVCTHCLMRCLYLNTK